MLGHTRLIKSPKVFVTDSALAAHLATVDDLSAYSGEPLRGPLGDDLYAIPLGLLLS